MRTVTRILVLTDLVDSTKLVSAVGDQRAGALNAAVDRLTRDLLIAHDGLEIDKTDGFLLLFEVPSAALAFAVDLHDRLAALSAEEGVTLAMRVGLHRGEVGLRENPPEDVVRGAKPIEVEGLAKPLAARVMSLAVGNQTLVTDTMPRSELGEGIRWVDHGPWRLKGVEAPVRLWEVGRPERSPLAPPPDGEKAWRAITGPMGPQREALRKAWALRPVRGLVAVGVLAVAGGAFAYWDHTREKVSLHHQVEWTPDGPEGAGEPIPGQVRVRVIRRGGQVQEIDWLNPLGGLLPVGRPGENGLFFGLALIGEGMEPNWTQVAGWGTGRGAWAPRMVLVRSEDGTLVKLELREDTGLLASQALVEPTEEGLRLRWQTPYGAVGVSAHNLVSVERLWFDEQGRERERRFFDASGLVPALDADGIHGVRFVRDGLGRVVEDARLDKQGEPTTDRRGVTIQKVAYHGETWLDREVLQVHADGTPADPERLCSRWVQSEDGLETWCYGPDGEPDLGLLRPEGILQCHHSRTVWSGSEARTDCEDGSGEVTAVEVRRHDALGYPAEIRLETPDGAPLQGPAAWAVKRYFTDPGGRWTRTPEFLDVTGAPMLPRDSSMHMGTGVVQPRSWRYDDRGRLVELQWIDLDGKPLARNGFAVTRLSYDEGGRATEATLFGEDGAPAATRTGLHRQVHTLDAMGRTVEIARFGIDGEPVLDQHGAHRDLMKWDEVTRLVEVAWFDADGPTERRRNTLKSTESHKIVVSYDERSNVTRLDFYDADGSRGGNSKGRAAETLEWNERGQNTGAAFWGPDGEPVIGWQGFHRATYEPHAWQPNFTTNTAVYDTEGRLMKGPDGCHRWEGSWDGPGYLLDERCLDADGELAVSILGMSRVRYLVDGLDRISGVENLGPDDQLVAGPNGVARITLRYSDQGYLETWEQTGADGEPVHVDLTHPAVYRFAYDERGRVTGFAIEDEQGPVGVGRVGLVRDTSGAPTMWRWPETDTELHIGRDNSGRPVRLAWQNSDGKPIDGAQGWSVASVDATPRVDTYAFTRADGSPARLGGYPTWTQGDPIAAGDWNRGPHPGELIVPQMNIWWRIGQDEFTHFPEGPEQVAWSGYRIEYGRAGEMAARTFLDGEGRPGVPTDPGFATARFETTPEGFVERRYFGPDGEPMEVCGAAGLVLRNGRPTPIDLEGQPTDLPEECYDRQFGIRQRSPAAPQD